MNKIRKPRSVTIDILIKYQKFGGKNTDRVTYYCRKKIRISKINID